MSVSNEAIELLKKLAAGGHLVWGHTNKDNTLVELVDSNGVHTVWHKTHEELKDKGLIVRTNTSRRDISIAGRALLEQVVPKLANQ